MENFHLKNNLVGRWINHTGSACSPCFHHSVLWWQRLKCQTWTTRTRTLGRRATSLICVFALKTSKRIESNAKWKKKKKTRKETRRRRKSGYLRVRARATCTANGIQFSVWFIGRHKKKQHSVSCSVVAVSKRNVNFICDAWCSTGRYRHFLA